MENTSRTIFGCAKCRKSRGGSPTRPQAGQFTTFQRIVIAPLRFLWLRSVNRFHPLDARGDSVNPISFASTSIATGTPGSAPCKDPAVAVPPLIVTTPSFSNWPDQTNTPDEGPL